MANFLKRSVLGAVFAVGMLPAAMAAEVPAPVAAPGETVLMVLQAEGAQVYECKSDTSGRLAWTFREPVATLMRDGVTVGRHYAGPHWELVDGSIVSGRVTGRAPGATPADIALLKLEVATRKGEGGLAQATTIQRLATKGGALEGACESAGALKSVAYSTDYVFLKK